MTPTNVSGATAVNLDAYLSHDYEHEALRIMRVMARDHGYTPRATASLLADRGFVTDVGSLQRAAFVVQYLDPNVPTACAWYTATEWTVGRGRSRLGAPEWRRSQRLLDGVMREARRA